MSDTTQALYLIRGKAEWLKIPIVADIAVFPDGRSVLAWRGDHPSVAVYPTLRDLYEVHRSGHKDENTITAIVTPDREAELCLDPWHPESFIGTPAEGVFQVKGPRRLVWLKIDWVGNAVGMIGYAEPEPEEDVRKIPLEQILADLKRDGIDPEPLIQRTREQIRKLKETALLHAAAPDLLKWLKSALHDLEYARDQEIFDVLDLCNGIKEVIARAEGKEVAE